MIIKPAISISDTDWDDLIEENLIPYLQTLTGNEDALNAKVHWQTFDDAFKKGYPDYRPYLARSVFGPYHSLKDSLRKANREGAGIYIAVNETNGVKRSKETITRVRAVWAEFDGPQVDLDALALSPSMVVVSHHGPHLYWLVDGQVSPDECRVTVQAIAARLQGDPVVHDPSRVLRAPGFYHLKDPAAPFLVKLVKAEPIRYTLQEIKNAFPAIPSGGAKNSKDKAAALEDEQGDQRDHEPEAPVECSVPVPDRIVQAKAYIAKIPGAAQGTRHHSMLNVAAVLARGFALPDGAALPLLQVYASRCEPPVEHSQCPYFLEEARQYGTEPTGGRVRDPLPTIEVTTDEKDVADQAVDSLVKAGGLFHRGQRLVHIVTEGRPASKLKRPEGAPHIAAVHVHHLRERIAAAAKFYKLVPQKNSPNPHAPIFDKVPVHVPIWCPQAIHSRGTWQEIPYLQGVVTTPVLREDGSILDRAGYDPASGIFLFAQSTFPSIPMNPSEAQAREALESLREVFCDFPFAKAVHEAANLAAVLTPFVRSAMAGPAPLFNYDANVRGAGKTLGADAVGIIATGRPLARMPQAPNDEEEEKRLAGIAQDGDAIVLIDNITRPLGSGALDAILTSTRWKPRILGKTGNPEFEVKTTFLATSNNVQLVGDIARRTLHIRLCSATDHPEDRKDFRHPALLQWVTENHPRLAVAALTVLRAYVVAGRPMIGITPWGSFEEWSRWVREPIVWLLGVDPMHTREELESHSNIESGALQGLVDGWKSLFPGPGAHTIREMLLLLNNNYTVEPGLREALCTLCSPKPGLELPDGRSLGNKFKMLRERPIGEWCFIPGAETAAGQSWRLISTAEGLRRSSSL